jgi:hypothetical protein
VLGTHADFGRINLACALYFVDNNTLFHNKQFVKCHLFTGNSASFSRANLDYYLIRRFLHISDTSRNMLPILNINISVNFTTVIYQNLS